MQSLLTILSIQEISSSLPYERTANQIGGATLIFYDNMDNYESNWYDGGSRCFEWSTSDRSNAKTICSPSTYRCCLITTRLSDNSKPGYIRRTVTNNIKTYPAFYIKYDLDLLSDMQPRTDAAEAYAIIDYKFSSDADYVELEAMTYIPSGTNLFRPKVSPVFYNENGDSSLTIRFRNNGTTYSQWQEYTVDNVYLYGFHPVTLSPTPYPTPYPTPVPYQTKYPTIYPTAEPSLRPSFNPTVHPSFNPSINPSSNPSLNPSLNPSFNPSSNPSLNPSLNPPFNPSINPSLKPSLNPSLKTSVNPSLSPSLRLSLNPSAAPTSIPIESESNMRQNGDTNDKTLIIIAAIVVIGLICIVLIMVFAWYKVKTSKYKYQLQQLNAVNNDDTKEDVNKTDRNTFDKLNVAFIE